MEIQRTAMNKFRQDVAHICQEIRDGKYVMILTWHKEDVVVMMSRDEWIRLKEIEEEHNATSND